MACQASYDYDDTESNNKSLRRLPHLTPTCKVSLEVDPYVARMTWTCSNAKGAFRSSVHHQSFGD